MNASLAGVNRDDAEIGRILAGYFSAEWGNTARQLDFPAELLPSWAESANVLWEDEHPTVFITSGGTTAPHMTQEIEVDLTNTDFCEPVTSVPFRVMEQRMFVADDEFLTREEVEAFVDAIATVARLFSHDGAVL